jgi:DNA-binding CsgD family transcriptional regulator
VAELALWAGRPGEALAQVQRGLALASKAAYYQAKFCGHLLASGLRACADLAEQARAARGEPAAALAAADELAAWADHTGGTPFTDHPFVATIPAERATWHAERSRLAGSSDPDAWHTAAASWQDLDCPPRAGYAWWRQAEALLYAGHHQAAATPLRAAAEASAGHAPLLSQIRTLAQRARITLPAEPPAHADPTAPTVALPEAGLRGTHGLTSRELAVLRLLAAGHTNGQIGAELFISPKTASVHVTSILRKLGVTGRVQAAAVAERAGLLDDRPD